MFNDSDIPPYAILSHTWGIKEVTFEDIIEAKGRTKAGYKKILFCARQAATDGLQHCWVDSCCIDRSSSAELSEAINSMFRWYQNAKCCYVYLADVSKNGCNGEPGLTGSWMSVLRKSRWFTRGWTLQELLAPRSVEFFTKEGEYLGNKRSLEEVLHEITEIPITALRNQPLRDFGVEERFCWAATRETTRKEDRAYCLLGIFDIHMPLLYGEGEETAMKRLRSMAESATDGPTGAVLQMKLSGLRQWLAVPNPSTQPQRALQDRFREICLWVLESDKYARWKTGSASILWLHGLPGSGKTVISTAILQDLLESCNSRSNGVSAHFYFEFHSEQTKRPDTFLRSLICQLSQNCVQMPASLDTLFALRDNGHGLPSLQTLLGVLRQMILEFPQVFLLVEALDECTQRPELMQVLATIAGWRLQNLHLLMTSRAEQEIKSFLEDCVGEKYTIDLERDMVDKDRLMNIFINHHLAVKRLMP
ncbi:hypothetical protein OPT61_g7362 [Boeremia exigua]|uniref:Uncharacterized protein n=1 Tax=Boeremia exigua TaxID=749465 RepID=A0ACC2I3J2_9PLEO|nr:hypothetical protein OPT61_g7362 [Boeremia exigua]